MAEDEGTDFGAEIDEDENDEAADNTSEETSGAPKPTPSVMVTRDELQRVIRQRDRLKQRLRDAAAPAEEDDEPEPAKKTDDKTSRESARMARELEKATKSLADMRNTVITSAAKAAFVSAGAIIPDGEAGKKAMQRLIKMIELEDVDFDGSDVTGIEDQVADIKRDMGHLFADAKKKLPRLRGADSSRTSQEGNGKVRTSAERLAEVLNNRR